MHAWGGVVALSLGAALAGCHGCTGSSSDARHDAGEASTSSSARAVASSSASPYRRLPAKPLAAIPDRSVERASHGITTVARPLITWLTADDGARIALAWRGDLPAPKNEATSAWTEALMDSLGLDVRAPDGKEHHLEVVPAPSPPSSRKAWFRPSQTVIARLTSSGVELEGRGQRSWKQPVDSLFNAPGSYRFVLRGRLQAEAGPIDFETSEISVELVPVGPEVRPLSELERTAATQLFGADRVDDVLSGRTWVHLEPFRALEDERHDRWLWFVASRGGGSGERTDIHVALSAAGEVIAADGREEFTCVAEGTRIATPDGSSPIEDVRVGDVVVGWDETARQEVETRVVAIAPRPRTPVIELEGLRITPGHPVLVGGAWTDAGRIEPGDLLRTRSRGEAVLGEPPTVAGLAVVYDLAVEHPHNFFAGDILVHNKAAPRSYPSDAWGYLFDRPPSADWPDRTWWGR
ncbi:MAG: hypothetical protein HOV80_17330 [Polyangiaceae bacterium]|nr:hypothetical protein [Polyangiaceae bacterium]